MTIVIRAALAIAAFLSIVVAMPAAAADTVYVIRHLEKGEGADPALTAEGAAGAGTLAAMLADKNVKAIYATATRRAHDTAAPLAKRLGIPVTTYDPSDPGALVKAVGAVQGAVLVVGHSNTVPDLVARFGGARPADIGDDEFGTLYMIHVGSSAVEQVSLSH